MAATPTRDLTEADAGTPEPEAVQESQTYSKLVWQQFRRNRPALVSLAAIGVLALTAMFADFLAGNKPYFMKYGGKTYFPAFRQYAVYLRLADWQQPLRRRRNFKRLNSEYAIFPPVPYGPSDVNLSEKYEPPGTTHFLGTDRLGRDVLSGLIHGTRYALTIGLVSVAISMIPALFLIITVAAFFPPSLFFVMMILGFTGWVGIARLTRSQFLQVRSYDFVSAARSLGYSSGRIMFIHILPNAIAPVLIPAAFGVAGAILAESGLSFLGIGVPAEAITWGAILAGARNNTAAWWLVIVPGFAIFITVTLYNLLGDGLRDALDPKMKI
jgi:peptide/nickel transport system permease protein